MKFVKVKYGKGSIGSNSGCEGAPDKLLDENFKEEVIEVEIDESNVDETMKNISNVEGDFFVGGDHSITYGSFKGFAKDYKNPGIIMFDAHPDLEVNSGSVSHEDFLRKLVEEGVLKKQNIILVGIRKISKNEYNFIRGMHVYKADRIFRNEENVCDSVTELAMDFDGLYLTIDIDVLDPAFAPGTGYLEVGGMNLNQLIYFLKRIKNMKNLKRIDLVEINPSKDVNEITLKIGKSIIDVFRYR